MSKDPLRIIAGTADCPLVINGIEIPCYVLEDETRVLSERGFLGAIGRDERLRSGQKSDAVKLPVFLRAKNLASFISDDLLMSSNPIRFQAPSAGAVAYGYGATLLPQVCEVFLKAREAGVLYRSQEHIAKRAEILIRGLANVGIIALVDEATGFQEMRASRALAIILEKFIAKELQPWIKTFPNEYYAEIFRLKGWSEGEGVSRPQVIAHYTNDIVYERLAPGALGELQRLNPMLPTGGRKVRHHQWLTPELGHVKLNEHLASITALMRISIDWATFQRHLQTAYPKMDSQMAFPG